MRRGDDLGKTEEAIVRRRLDLEDVEPGAAEGAPLDGVGEGSLVDESAARRIDDARRRLAAGQPFRREQRLGAGGRHVQGDEVRGRAQLVQLHELDVEIRGDLTRDEGVVRDALHAEGVGPVDHFPADAAEADDAQGLAAHLDPQQALLLPAARLEQGVGLRHGPGGGEQEGQRMFGHADAVGPRRVDDQHPARARRVEVDVVDAGARARDDLEPGRAGEQLGIHPGRAADDQGVGIHEGGLQPGPGPPGLGIDGPSLVAKQICRRRRQGIGYDDLHSALVSPWIFPEGGDGGAETGP